MAMAIAPEKVRRRTIEESGRITPRMVLDAYEATGLTPMRTAFKLGDNACAAGALAAVEGVETTSPAFHRFIARRGETYMVGFYAGFDDALLASLARRTPEYRRGYFDGQRVARFVFPNNGGV